MLERAESEVAYTALRNAVQRSSVLRAKVRAGTVELRAAVLRQKTGLVEWLPPRPEELELRAPPVRAPGPRHLAGVPPHVALDLLRGGHRRFLRGGKGRADLTTARRHTVTADSQRPIAAILTGVDPSLAPPVVFDTGVGDLWTVRTPAVALTPEAVASLEVAVQDHGVSLVAVIADAHSTFIRHALAPRSREAAGSTLRQQWADLDPLIARAKTEGHEGQLLVRRIAELRARDTLKRLRDQSPTLREFERRGEVGVLAALYDSKTGDLEWLPDDTTTRGFLSGVAPLPVHASDATPIDVLRLDTDPRFLADLEDHGAFSALRREIARRKGTATKAKPRGGPKFGDDEPGHAPDPHSHHLEAWTESTDPARPNPVKRSESRDPARSRSFSSSRCS